MGHYSRSFSLSSKIDQSGISAKVEDGVPYLVLPKTKEAVPRRIAVDQFRARLNQPCEQCCDAEEAEKTGDAGDGGEND